MGREDVALGSRVLTEFRDELGATSLATLLSSFDDDGATTTLRTSVGEELVLSIPAHRVALLGWLRSWGCRHLRVADTRRSSVALDRWWRAWADAIPRPERTLTGLTVGEREALGRAYAALASLGAASRAAATGDVAVTFGDTAAAKALYAIRPRACPPWDEPIRLAFGRTRADGDLYARYLAETADALHGCARRLGVRVERLPALFGRPAATPARVIDEYLWLRVTRGR